MIDVLKLLKRVRAERAEALSVQMQIDELRSSLLPSGIRYDTDKVQTSPADQMLEIAARVDELQRKNATHLARLTEDLIQAVDIVQKIDAPECRQLLTLRYLTGNRITSSWESIANTMGYSVDHVRGYLHQRAIREARKVNTL